MARYYDEADGEYRDDGTPDPFARPVQSAATAPPIYPGPAGSTYTNFEGQPSTVPTTTSGPNGPISSIDQPMWQALWQQSNQNPQQFVQAVIGQLGLQGRQTDPTALNTILRALQAVGVNATLDQRNDAYHKGIIINGQFVRLLDGSDRWTWQPGGGGSAERGGGGDLLRAIDPSYLSPFSKPVPTFTGAPAFNYPDFQGPTGEDVLKDPGYQFRLGQGRLALETGASARGLLNSGGTLRDILQFGQQLGSQEYGNAFNRARDTYATNRSNAAENYRQNYDVNFLDPFARKLQTFDREQDLWFRNQSEPFKKLYDLSSLGLSAASA